MIRTTYYEEDFDDTQREPEGWGDGADENIDESALDPETKAALAFFNAPVLEAEYIEPTKSADAPDESSHPIPPETSNYDHNPANDHSGEEFMKDAADANLEMESAICAACAGLLF